jgi:hypothetical protein
MYVLHSWNCHLSVKCNDLPVAIAGGTWVRILISSYCCSLWCSTLASLLMVSAAVPCTHCCLMLSFALQHLHLVFISPSCIPSSSHDSWHPWGHKCFFCGYDHQRSTQPRCPLPYGHMVKWMYHVCMERQSLYIPWMCGSLRFAPIRLQALLPPPV